jgi:hypothetical protein
MASSKLAGINVVLIATFIAIALGCGGYPETPPQGSFEAKLCGRWIAESAIEEEYVKVDFSFWNFGLKASFENTQRCLYAFKVIGNSAISDPERSDDHSQWEFELSRTDPQVMFMTCTLKDGKKKFDKIQYIKEQSR